LPNTQLRKAINIIEHGKVVAKELAVVNQKVSILEYAVNLKDSSLAQYRIKDQLHNQMVTRYEASITNYKTMLANNEQSLKIQRTMVRRQKLAKWGTFLAGLGGGYLIFR
jgi:formylmethanofuran dehydrogenase subunit A